MGVIRRLLALAVLLVGVSLVGVVGFAFFYERPAELPEGANIVVLSAGIANGQMDRQTAERTAAGIALYQELTARGETPLLVMSGGRSDGDPAAKATLMADAARAAGVPVGDLRVEVESHSTLQNALFSRDILGDRADAPLILVTHRYHLPRAGASFWWAGNDDLTLVSAEAGDAAPTMDGLILEGVKWPANVLRAGIYSGLAAAGVNGRTLTPLLR
jgi:uncharacterized SAM-binding protein YcdF (DUF218 family)